MSRISILGASGYIGSWFVTECQRRGHEVIAIGRRDTNLYDVDSLRDLLHQQSPDFVINCAGYTGKPNVDACELHKAECLAGNAVLPGVIAEACQQLDLVWGHISSGCIYSGTRPDGTGFREQDSPNFCFRSGVCSFYSGCKALGEEVLDTYDNVYQWRLRIPFSNVDHARNYISKLLRYDVLLDVQNSLSFLPDFVAAALDSLERRLPTGVYNLTNSGSIGTRDITALIHKYGLSDREFRYFDDEAHFMRTAAKTPRSNCILDNSKAIALGLALPSVHSALTQALQHWSTSSL